MRDMSEDNIIGEKFSICFIDTAFLDFQTHEVTRTLTSNSQIFQNDKLGNFFK